MAKQKKSLPLYIVTNQEDGSRVAYINRAYVRTALQGLQIMIMNGGNALDEIKRLVDEMNGDCND